MNDPQETVILGVAVIFYSCIKIKMTNKTKFPSSHAKIFSCVTQTVGLQAVPKHWACHKFLSGKVTVQQQFLKNEVFKILERAEFARSFSLKGVVFTNCHFWQAVFAANIVIAWNGVQERNGWESLKTEIVQNKMRVPAPIKPADCVWITENNIIFCY